MVRIIFTVALLIALVGQSFAQIKEASDSLVGRREHAILTRIHNYLHFPNTVMPGASAVAEITVEGSNIAILVVGPVSGHAKAYAQKIEDWRVKSGFKGTTYFSQEDDCAVAGLTIKTGGFGKMESKLVVPIEDFVRNILTSEPFTRVALITPTWTNLDTLVKPEYVASNGTRYWEISDPTKIPTTTSTLTISGWIVPALIAWVFLPLVGMGICFGLGITVAKNTAKPIEERRKFYSTVVVKGTYVVLGLHTILVMATLPTRALDPVSQLWFGFRFSQIGLFIVPLFAIVPILMLPWLNKVEKKLLGATPAEAAKKEDFTSYQVPQAQMPALKKRLLLKIIPLVVIMGFVFLPLGKNNPLASFQLAAVPLYIFGDVIFSTIKRSKKSTTIEPQIPNGETYLTRVQQRIQPIAAKLEVVCPPISIGQLLQGPYGGAITTKMLTITPAMADRFGDEELDFVLAHELAHLKAGHLKMRKMLVFVPAILIWFLLMFLIVGRSFSLFVSPFVTVSPFTIILVALPVYTLLVSKKFRIQEYQADEMAVRVTGHKDGAMRALIKIAEQNSLPGFDEVVFNRSHPKIMDRIARIRALQNV